jgi:nitrogen fixation NifU-like protein
MLEAARDLYQQAILERSRQPRHGVRLAAFDATARADNPMCGDRVQVWVKAAADGTIAQTGFEARGCALSIAAADLMAEAVIGRTREQVQALFTHFGHMARTGEFAEGDTALESLRPFAGVHEYPSRVKCATLAWQALLAALDGKGDKQ